MSSEPRFRGQFDTRLGAALATFAQTVREHGKEEQRRIGSNWNRNNSFQEDPADTGSRNRASPMSIKSTCEWEMQSSASGRSRLPPPPMTRGRREKPGKLRALEVRLVREVQVLNLRSHRRDIYRNVPSYSFRNACMKAAQKHTASIGRNRVEIRRMALADMVATSWWCKARGSETLFSNDGASLRGRHPGERRDPGRLMQNIFNVSFHGLLDFGLRRNDASFL